MKSVILAFEAVGMKRGADHPIILARFSLSLLQRSHEEGDERRALAGAGGQEVRSSRAVWYFSAVRAITLSGRRGAGGSRSQSTESR